MSNDGGPPLLRPRPRRPFEIGPLSSTDTSSHPSPDSFAAQSPTDADLSSAPPSRSRSILNLTSSTLAGVFGFTSEEPQTPLGAGAETPMDGLGLHQELGALLEGKAVDEALMLRNRERRSSMLDQSAKRSRSFRRPAKPKGVGSPWLPALTKTIALAVSGVAYAALISHLQDRRQLAPVQVEGLDHSSASFLIFWGAFSVALGWLLPYVDSVWNAEDEEEVVEFKSGADSVKSTSGEARRGWAPVWNDLARTSGAVCGVAFAIRRIPWHSTLQLSLTLALANPTFWYLLDRSAPGFILSTTVALSGTALLLGINPDLVPSPSVAQSVANETLSKAQFHQRTTSDLVAGVVSNESVGVATWIASVLFVSCVCFGSLGRRL